MIIDAVRDTLHRMLKSSGGMVMVSVAPIGDDPVFVEVQVNSRVRIATELAAIAGSKPVSEFLEDILVDYLAKSGYLEETVDLKESLVSN